MDLSEFEMIRKIGEGGFGEVFLAVPKGLKKPDNIPMYAVKMLKQQYCLNPKIVRHFVKEAKALSELDDPCVLKVLHSGMEGERPYYISRYYDKSLVDLLAEELPLDTIISISYDLLSALKYIEGTFVHRDVKPSNILIYDEKHAVLADFGICIDERKGLTTPDNLLNGTIEYMAPERLISAGDHRSDIYSAGAVIYELFVRKSHKALHKGKVIAPSEAYRGISAEFDRVIFKALEGDVKDRYQSAEDMRSALTLEYSRLDSHVSAVKPISDEPKAFKKKNTTPPKPVFVDNLAKYGHVKKPINKKRPFLYAAAAVILPVAVFSSSYYLRMNDVIQLGPKNNVSKAYPTQQKRVIAPVTLPVHNPAMTPTSTPTNTYTPTSTSTRTPWPTFTATSTPTPTPNYREVDSFSKRLDDMATLLNNRQYSRAFSESEKFKEELSYSNNPLLQKVSDRFDMFCEDLKRQYDSKLKFYDKELSDLETGLKEENFDMLFTEMERFKKRLEDEEQMVKDEVEPKFEKFCDGYESYVEMHGYFYDSKSGQRVVAIIPDDAAIQTYIDSRTGQSRFKVFVNEEGNIDFQVKGGEKPFYNPSAVCHITLENWAQGQLQIVKDNSLESSTLDPGIYYINLGSPGYHEGSVSVRCNYSMKFEGGSYSDYQPRLDQPRGPLPGGQYRFR